MFFVAWIAPGSVVGVPACGIGGVVVWVAGFEEEG